MKKSFYYALIANLLIPVAGISTDIYLPSLPAITEHFAVDKSLAQYTVAAFIFAMGLCQFIAGPISDSKGRKPIIITALVTQLLAVVGVLLSPSIHLMILFRFIQGAGAAFMIVPARAIINDLFEGPALKKQLYYITISFALGPILGPFIGGYLQEYFGWEANFIFMLSLIFIMLLFVVFTIKETIKSKTEFHFSHWWQKPKQIIHNRLFVGHTLLSGTVYAYTMTFNIAGPFIIQVILNQSAITYGHIALLNGVAWFSGNFLNRVTHTVDHNLKTIIMLLSSVMICLTFLTFLTFSVYGHLNLYVFAIPVIALLFCSSIIFSTQVNEALSMFPAMAASVNAVFFSSSWLIAGGFTLLATRLKVHSLVPIAVTFLVVSLFNVLIFIKIRRLEIS